MQWWWTEACWTDARLRLAHAVYEKTRKESAYAPMFSPLGSGNLLLRSFERKFLGANPQPVTIPIQAVLESIRVRDARQDRSRFSGLLPPVQGKPAHFPLRGGLYCSEDIHAAMAEMFQYADANLSRALIGNPARLGLFTQRCFVSLRVVGELDVVSLNSESSGMLPFLARLQSDPAVTQALAALHYQDLFAALYAERDYSAGRGLGLGLESNPEIDGVQIVSARDYETDAGMQRVMRTGDNVMLFGLDQALALDKVRVESLHLVDAVPGGSQLRVSHYGPGAGGVFRKTGTAARFTP